jgi:beta-N-acetylhexosaminidase
MTTVSAPASGMAPKDSFRTVRRFARLVASLFLRLGTGRGLTLVACAALAAGALVGVDETDRTQPLPEASGGEPVERISFLARIVPPAPERQRRTGPRVPRSIADLARRLPLERKVAQLFLWGFRGKDLSADIYSRLRRLDLGGIVVDFANYTNPQTLGLQSGEAIVISQQAKHVPPWVMAVQEGGEFNAFPDLPPASAPADLRNARDAGRQAATAAATLRPLGVTGLLAPVIDVGPEDDPALGPRVYSDDAEAVAGFADATVRAYRKARLLAAVKHFPGLGSASQPTEEGPATVGLTLADLRKRDLVPFRAAFAAGAPAVVLSHALYQMDDFTTPASLSRRVATGVLRGDIRFRGLAITDDLADPAITAFTAVPDAAVRALRAGADVLYISGPPRDQQAAYVAVLRAVRRRQVSRRRVDEALFRVLIAKLQYGVIR